jgi:hypothetical protein
VELILTLVITPRLQQEEKHRGEELARILGALEQVAEGGVRVSGIP